MGKRGPSPTPTKLLKLTGSRVPEERAPEPEFTTGMPDPPMWLTEFALKEWHRMAGELVDLGLLGPESRALFATYCQAWANYQQAEKMVQKHGSIGDSTMGTPIIHPWVRIRDQERKALFKAAAEFGLSPASRVGIGADSKEASDPLGAFTLKKGKAAEG